eukprot:880318-Ditylum_brightwellii.AAC.2
MHKGEDRAESIGNIHQSILCEPTNEVSDKDKSYRYLYTFPNELPLYLKEFAAEGNNGDDGTTDISNRKVHIVDGPAMLTCIRPGNGEHVFRSRGISCLRCMPGMRVLNMCCVQARRQKEEKEG